MNEWPVQPIAPSAPSASAEQSASAPPRRSAKRFIITLLLRWPWYVLPLLGLLFWGWQRTGTGPANGVSISGTNALQISANLPHRLRVGIYNIQGSVGKEDKAALERVAKTIAETDLCALNEVRGNALTWNGVSQAQTIGESLGRPWLYAPAERRFWRDVTGNGVICRLPTVAWTRTPLPAKKDPGSHRNAVVLQVQAGRQILRVLVTHLDRGESKPGQLESITQMFDELPAPAVLLADLNTGPLDPLLAPVLSLPGVEDAIATKFGKSPERVDWILTKGLKTLEVGRVDARESDHAFFWADVELPE